jgi:hypothetical protein
LNVGDDHIDPLSAIQLSDSLSPFTVVEGTIGGDARVMGGASVPLLSNFAIDGDVLFKENA